MKVLSEEGYLRRPSAADHCGVSERTISDWQRRRIIPFVKMGRKCVLFKRADLDAALDRFKVKAVRAGGVE